MNQMVHGASFYMIHICEEFFKCMSRSYNVIKTYSIGCYQRFQRTIERLLNTEQPQDDSEPEPEDVDIVLDQSLEQPNTNGSGTTTELEKPNSTVTNDIVDLSDDMSDFCVL